jgi:hypothetical protein
VHFGFGQPSALLPMAELGSLNRQPATFASYWR